MFGDHVSHVTDDENSLTRIHTRRERRTVRMACPVSLIQFLPFLEVFPGGGKKEGYLGDGVGEGTQKTQTRSHTHTQSYNHTRRLTPTHPRHTEQREDRRAQVHKLMPTGLQTFMSPFSS